MLSLSERTNFENAKSDWAEFLAADQLISDADILNSYESATFSTTQKVLAVLKPKNTAQVSRLVATAAKFQVPIYPISCGKNWGLGSRVPPTSNAVVVDLSGMNRIREFSEEDQYLRVEPGVTFQMASDYLLRKKSALFISVIGGPPHASIIGNSLERGEGLGPLGDRTRSVCNLEVVTGTGEILNSGFGSITSSQVSSLNNLGIGPSLDGLFFQSTFGVVTALSIWLMKKPKSFRVFMFSLNSGSDPNEALSACRSLHQSGVIQSNSLAVWNKYKLLASQSCYPWDKFSGELLDGDKLEQSFPRKWRNVELFGFGALYASTKCIGRSQEKAVKASLKQCTDKLTFFSPLKAHLLWFAHPLLQRFSGVDVRDLLDTLYYQSVYLGNPTRKSLKSVYWRKKKIPTGSLDPDRDKCGVIWICHTLPFHSEAIQFTKSRIEETCCEYELEPNIAYLNVSPRSVHVFVALIYDLESETYDFKAKACQRRLSTELTKAGFPPYRLTLDTMQQMSLLGESERNFLRAIKSVFDPQNIISRGRYPF